MGWTVSNGLTWEMKSGNTAVDAESPEDRRIRKGKGRAEPRVLPQLPCIPGTPQPVAVPLIMTSVSRTNEVVSDGEDWLEQAKRRRAWWRKEVLQEPYNQLFTIIPRVRAFDPLSII
jgi:hypothetical protein